MDARKDRPPYVPDDVIGGKYLVQKVLGEGGMAVVFAALDRSCGRQVAVKVLRPSAAARRSLSSEHVELEASLAVKLHERTDHVVEVLTAGITDDQHRLPYYVMERLRGTSLRTAMEENRRVGQSFEVIEVASMVTEIATALAFAHEMGIVHFDVKPENVYLAKQRDNSYKAKLIDFGIGALVADVGGTRRRRAFSGSRAYASPEQLDGQAPSTAGDIYALGLLMFEMLVFTLPHDRLNNGLSVAQTGLNVLQMPVPPLRTWRNDIPPRLERLVQNCLAYDPDERPQALLVAQTLRDVKRVIEQKLLGSDDVNVTDVTGPPAALLQRPGNVTEDAQRDPPPSLAATAPVDRRAETVDEAEAPAEHELFFMGPVHGDTQPMPLLVGDADPSPTIEPQRVVMLTASVPSAGAEPERPHQPSSAEPVARRASLTFPDDELSALLPSQHTPEERSTPSLEAYASRTASEPLAVPRRARRRALMALPFFAVPLLLLCGLVVRNSVGQWAVDPATTHQASAVARPSPLPVPAIAPAAATTSVTAPQASASGSNSAAAATSVPSSDVLPARIAPTRPGQAEARPAATAPGPVNRRPPQPSPSTNPQDDFITDFH